MLFSHTLSQHQGNCCPYCNRKMGLLSRQLMPTRDHYPIPKSRGGKCTIICCYTCNHLKGNMGADEWLAFMSEDKGGWFATRSPKVGLPDIPVAPLPAKPLPFSESIMILKLGKKAWKEWKSRQGVAGPIDSGRQITPNQAGS